MKYFFILVLFFVGSQLKAQDIIKMKTPAHANEAFASFLQKEKYGPNEILKFDGIQNVELKNLMTRYTDQIALDFKDVALSADPTDIKYQEKIMHGLSRFNGVKASLSKIERARVCHYIIELMDIVDLKSSRGQLNLFTYGLDAATMEVKTK